jgi:transposase
VRRKGSAEVLEDRRRRALALLRKKLSLNEVARRMGCAASSVLRWQRAWEHGGRSGLRVRKSPGRPHKLSVRNRQRLVALLLKGARAHGYQTELWTTARIAEVIRREFGVQYHRDHIGRVMATLGWSHQKPERRARERDEAAIARWRRRQWPRVKKTLPGWVPTSSSSTNLVVKTWAPRRQTPVLAERMVKREKISAISAISVSPRRQRLGLYYHLYRTNIRQHQVCQFLRYLLRHLRGQVVLLLDNAKIHRSRELWRLQARQARLHLEYFPGYAPELNPDEGVWTWAKRMLANGQPDTIEVVHAQVDDVLTALRSSRTRLRACIDHSTLPPFLR